MMERAIPFSLYMQDALYGQDGYYMGSRNRFGKDGDFYTSAQVSPIFGELWAHFVMQVTTGERYNIVEMGVGDGDFAASLLAELIRVGDKPIDYAGIELSPLGRARTTDKLQQVLANGSRVAVCAQVYTNIEEVLIDHPATFQGGFVFANEWLDAIPCERLRITADGAVERLWVTTQTNSAVSEWKVTEEPALLEYAKQWIVPLLLENDVAQIVTEVSLQSHHAVTQVIDQLSPSWMALVDYGGHTADVVGQDRPQGSLRAYREHQLIEDFLNHKGQVDLTYDVDFSPIMSLLEQMGYRNELKKQGIFLMTQPFFEQVVNARSVFDSRVFQTIKTLVLPGGMGERFFVLIAERRQD